MLILRGGSELEVVAEVLSDGRLDLGRLKAPSTQDR